MRKRIGKSLRVIIVSIALLLFVVPAMAQEAGVRLASAYLALGVEPGDTTTLSFQLDGPVGEEVDLSVSGLPDGWTARIRGGGFLVERVQIEEGLEHDLRLEVDVPADAADGTYEVTLEAAGSASSDTLTFQLQVTAAATGGVSLNAEFPALSGPSDVTFSYDLELTNDTGAEIQFGLQAQGPPGWQLTATPAGETRASTVTVPAGGSERITVTADPPDNTPAGAYPVLVQASGSGESAETELTVEITGNYALSIITPDERLNVDVEAGNPSEMTITVLNEGTAPLLGVTLSATPPRNWVATFSPDVIEVIEPGAAVDVTATITPSEDAITGDYQVTMRASVPEASDSVEVRATVETSSVWGLVGVGVIVIALGALVAVFRQFGRR